MRRALLPVLIIILILLAGCSKNKAVQPEPRSAVYYSYFDTVTFIYSYAGDDEEAFEKNAGALSSILREYHILLDIYNEYEGVANLCTVNKNAGGEPVRVDAKLIDFLVRARELCLLTDCETDMMMGSVFSIWHDAIESQATELPSEQELLKAREHTGLNLLEIDEKACTVRISDPEASIDVGAIGKGYAAEMCARYLKENGLSGYVVNLGGNLRCVGTKTDGSGWKTGIMDPKDPENLALTVTLSDTSCVTSGDYKRFFTVGGKRYSHLIDTDTLYPAEYFSSVSVITEDSALADALSTALFCMPYEDGLELVSAMDGVQCIWIFPDGRVSCTKALEPLITIL